MNINKHIVHLAKKMMNSFEVFPPDPEICIGRLGEVFQHPIFLNGSEAQKRWIMNESSNFFYQDEKAYPWDHYFGCDLTPMLSNADILDLGCFTGGRDTAWYERYGLKSVTGLDIRKICVKAATYFGVLKGIKSKYLVGVGEEMPFPCEAFDAILTFETFEHVQNLSNVIDECYRVLRPCGKIFVVFPSYFHPTSHHLGLVTKCPGLQWFFSGHTLVKAYYDILQERGEAASWYRRNNRELEPWERGNTINGTTVRRFSKLVSDGRWRLVMRNRQPIGSVGRNISKKLGARFLSHFLRPFVYLQGFEEIFLHRIAFILQKR